MKYMGNFKRKGKQIFWEGWKFQNENNENEGDEEAETGFDEPIIIENKQVLNGH